MFWQETHVCAAVFDYLLSAGGTSFSWILHSSVGRGFLVWNFGQTTHNTMTVYLFVGFTTCCGFFV